MAARRRGSAKKCTKEHAQDVDVTFACCPVNGRVPVLEVQQHNRSSFVFMSVSHMQNEETQLDCADKEDYTTPKVSLTAQWQLRPRRVWSCSGANEIIPTT